MRMWHMPPGILLVLLAWQLWYICDTQNLHLGYISKQISARFISITSTTSPPLQASTSLLSASPGSPMPSRLLLSLDYCLPMPSRLLLSHAQSTRACLASLSASQRGDRRLLAHESAWEAYRKLPWEQYYRHHRSIHCAHSRGTVTLVLAPLRTSQVPLIVPTPECTHRTVHSSYRPKRHSEPCRGTPPYLGAHSTLPLKRHLLLVAWKLFLSFCFSSLCYLCRPSALLCLLS